MQEKTIDHRLAWLAGIIDGEGWIGLGAMRESAQAGGRYINAQYAVSISNTDPAMLNEIMAIAGVLGVRYYFAPFKAHKPRHKPFGRVAFTGAKKCGVILRAVFPYLVTKRPQAELLLRAIAHRGNGHLWRRGGYVRLPDDSQFMQMVADVKALNRRGPAPQED